MKSNRMLGSPDVLDDFESRELSCVARWLVSEDDHSQKERKDRRKKLVENEVSMKVSG